MRRYYQVYHGAPDLVHSNYWLSGWVGMAFTSLLGIPQVHTSHSLGVVKYGCMGGLPSVAFTRLRTESELVARCRAVIATCQHDADNMRAYGRSARLTIVPCGVDDRLFSPRDAEASRVRLGLRPDLPVLVYAGRFHPQKGVETFVRAAGLVGRPHQAVLAGDGEELERMRSLAAELNLNATFLGKVGHDRLPLVYGAADVCVVPSHYESFGMVALEAMACGRPVVASDVGGLRCNVIPGRTGWLAPPGDEVAFADHLRQLLDNPGLARELGRNASAWVGKAFTWSTVADSLSCVYEEALAS